MKLRDCTPHTIVAYHMKVSGIPHTDLEGARKYAHSESDSFMFWFRRIGIDVRPVTERDERGQLMAQYCTAMIWLEAKEEVLKWKAEQLSEEKKEKVYVTRFPSSQWPRERDGQLALLGKHISNPEIVDVIHFRRPDAVSVVGVFFKEKK